MKIGILTWYDVLNYGSAFQAYALQEQIKMLGHEAEILRHDRKLPDYYGNSLNGHSIKSILTWVRNQTPRRIQYRNNTKRKYLKFQHFHRDYLNIGSHYRDTNSDIVLIGSDQVFDINGMYYPFQFGADISCGYISTYAPSFGETTIEKLRESPHFHEISNNINRLKMVNGRDKNTVDILSAIRQEDIPMTIDPVLLYPFEEEKQSWNKRLIDEAYCIIYTWGGYSTSAEFSRACQSFARNNHLKLVSIGETRPWCDIQFDKASPIEFFELYMHANMVLTNMFHGTCFSLIMNKPFYSFVMPHNENKLGGLLRSFDLESQILHSPAELSDSIPVMDYQRIMSELEEKRSISRDCLRRSISI